MPTKAKTPFWLDGGYDFECVIACPYHPLHNWWTFRLGDVIEHPRDPDEYMTICRTCYVPQCGTTKDSDRCVLWRHHADAHFLESGRVGSSERLTRKQ
jgi:hypothetical protein